uniref:Uncharacterized protein n=1 Tax=Neogobius melanostomus TaxID=47308 RepID=A0A8C6WPA5_9GOBI
MSLKQLEGALGKTAWPDQSLLVHEEAALLHYYLQGLLWSRDAHLSPLQTSFTMAVLHTLLHNITGQTDFLSASETVLFQKYQLFRALGSKQDELLLGSQVRPSHSQISP